MDQGLLVRTDIKEETGNLNVRFYETFYNGKEELFIRIDCPGDQHNVIDTIATDVHKARHKTRYLDFINNKVTDGTPIEEWEDQAEGMRAEFKHFGFNFIEQVANGSDSAFARIQGGTSWRNKARQYLDKDKVDAEVTIKQQNKQIKELEEKMAILMDNMNKPTDATESLSRDDLKKQAEELGIDFKNNIPTDKLVQLISENT